MEHIFLENYSAYNRFLNQVGLKQTENTTEPSEYITLVKMKKLFRNLSQEEIEDLFEKEMNLISLKIHREKLETKLFSLKKWQLFRAFKMTSVLVSAAALYVIGCRKKDIDPNDQNA